MENKTEVENEFRKKISLKKLKFTSLELENNYSMYKRHDKYVPKWTRMLIISLIVIVLARRLEILLLEIYISEYNATDGTINSEIYNISVLIIGIACEIVVFFWKKLHIIRGLMLLVSIFISVAYSSHTDFMRLSVMDN